MVPDRGAEARREVVERYALRDPDGSVVICYHATPFGKNKAAYPNERHAESAAAELAPLVEYPLTGYECANGDHWHLTTEWGTGPRPFSRSDRLVVALLAAPGGVMTFSEVRCAGQWRNYSHTQARRVVKSLERAGYVRRVGDVVSVTDRDGLLAAHLRKHPKADHDSDQVGAGS